MLDPYAFTQSTVSDPLHQRFNCFNMLQLCLCAQLAHRDNALVVQARDGHRTLGAEARSNFIEAIEVLKSNRSIADFKLVININ